MMRDLPDNFKNLNTYGAQLLECYES